MTLHQSNTSIDSVSTTPNFRVQLCANGKSTAVRPSGVRKLPVAVNLFHVCVFRKSGANACARCTSSNRAVPCRPFRAPRVITRRGTYGSGSPSGLTHGLETFLPPYEIVTQTRISMEPLSGLRVERARCSRDVSRLRHHRIDPRDGL